jgi:hypothetical protein
MNLKLEVTFTVRHGVLVLKIAAATSFTFFASLRAPQKM